ncbi:diphosphomevalonate decarboxylase [Actinomadura spongiicola]|uniref:diphosphomevalonate decarboxylase n=1 Tax=Actinomadura spongiicola TaxID=2303421 RepID=A0A372GFQ7_9ACTN|nr:diphosphomevalonate decarboxylase [Actinomadura spongiicola]RFS84215.1 diphosphomevalonate decarboxylase [Actinomadura spongiicola]
MPSDRRTAVAHPNIALIKYWGKRDERLAVPNVDSLSMTLDVFPTTTTVRLDPASGTDGVTLDGTPAAGEPRRRVVAFLDLLRELSGRAEPAAVDTRNTVPTGAGLASSASGFAALAVAGAAAYGLDLDPTALSRLARRGSVSAARSIFAAFAVCHAGRGSGAAADLGSHAEPLDVPEFDPALVIALVDTGPKTVSSRAAMRRTVATSPLYGAWAASAGADLADMRAALRRGDLAAVGEIAERNSLGMHATMLAARPAVRYLSPATLAVLDGVLRLRRDGVPAYATMDAGPNVKVLCHPRDAARVGAAVREAAPGCATVTARRGPGARLTAGADR